MDRQQHLKWCKQRAMEYVTNGDLSQGFASFMSDMGKHPETENHLALQMGTMLMISGNLSTKQDMKQWITGFN